MEEALAAIRGAQTLRELEAARVKYLGRKSELTQALREFGKILAENRVNRDSGVC